MNRPGTLLISLDLELFWGVRDKRTLESYRENLDGVREAVDGILDLFTEYGIRATWAAVGFLFFKNKAELMANLPEKLPQYEDESLCPYRYIELAGDIDDHYHFAPDIIEKIQATKGQEIATHTFSHYYCLEKGQNIDTFRADLQAAVRVAEERGIDTHSLVFARNQVRPDYLGVLSECDIQVYRGCESNWLYRPRPGGSESGVRRALRMVDSHVNLTGHHSYSTPGTTEGLVNLPASRFLRPVGAQRRILSALTLRRIERSMTRAAEHGEAFHLWWHPHNFGIRADENLSSLRQVLNCFASLRDRLCMQSHSCWSFYQNP